MKNVHEAKEGIVTTYFDLLAFFINRILYRRPNTILIDIIFPFGLI
jgi:hypothetical protein